MNVTIADVEAIGPNELSTVKLTPGMGEPVRHKHTLKDQTLYWPTTTYELDVTSMDGSATGNYDVYIHRTDSDLEIINVDTDENLIDNFVMLDVNGDGKLVKVYQALAQDDTADGNGPTKVNAYVKAASTAAHLTAKIPVSDVPEPTSKDNYYWHDEELDLTPFTSANLNPHPGYDYTDVGLWVKGIYGEAKPILRIYQPNDNTKVAFQVKYTTDLKEEGTANVYAYTDDAGETCYELALPNTVEFAEITGSTQHPLAKILGHRRLHRRRHPGNRQQHCEAELHRRGRGRLCLGHAHR